MRPSNRYRNVCRHVPLGVTFILLSLVAVVPLATAGPNDKVQICHIPPGNPANFHTISVNQHAVDNHLDHGDKLGPCGAHCESLCNDGNACTIDGCIPGTETCQPPTSRQPVDCNDTEVCTADSCNPTTGCVYTAQVGASCHDGNACTTDTCNSQGVCVGAPIICTASDQCHEAGVCDPGTGLCSNVPLADGTACDDGIACTQQGSCQAGVCASEAPDCRDPQVQSDQSYCDLTTGQCVMDTECPEFFTDTEGNENRCMISAGEHGIDPTTGLCLYGPKTCAPLGCNNEVCNPSTGACEEIFTPNCSSPFADGCVNGLGGGSTPCPLSRCSETHCSTLSATPVNCNSVQITDCVAQNPSTCQVPLDDVPGTVNGCSEVFGCIYTSVTCDPPDPCMDLVMDGTDPDCCTYRPKDCAGQFGNHPNYTYSCEVVGTEGVCRATPN